MATHDYVIDNQTSANARADINNALQAILTNNSSATAPTVTDANMFWYDTANNVLKMRNEADTAWIIVGYLNQTNNQMEVRTDVIQAASGSGIDVKNSSGTTIIDLSVASQSTAEAATNNTQIMTPLRVKQSIDANVVAAGWEYVGGSTGTNNTTQTVTGLNLYRTVKLTFSVTESGDDDFSATISAAVSGTYRTIESVSGRDSLRGQITIHNWNNADAPSGIKVLDASYRNAYPGEEEGGITDLIRETAVTIYQNELSYNETWDRARLTVSGGDTNTTWRFRVFGMR
jgi:hypothetical protein